MKAARRAAGIVIFAKGTCRCLLLRAYRYWDCPKGEIETGETPLETACREVREETGIDRLEFPWGAAFTETPPYAGGKIARYYCARTDQTDVHLPTDPDLGRPEHHEWRWVEPAAARALVGARVADVLDWAWRLTGCNR